MKSQIKNGTGVILKLSSNVVCDSSDENNFLRKLLLTNTQVSKLRKASANGSSANIKLSKTQLHKIGQPRGFPCRLLGPLLKTGLPAAVNPLGSTAVAATYAGIHKKMFGSSTGTLVFSNEDLNDVMNIIKPLKESDLLIKVLGKQLKMKQKKEGVDFLACY